MRLFMKLTVLALAMAVVIPVMAAKDVNKGIDPVSIIPGDSAVVAHLDVKSLIRSTLLKEKLKEFGEKLESSKEYCNFRDATGFDIARDLDSLTIAISKTMSGKDGEDFKGLIVAKGDFNPADIVKVFKSAAEDEGKELFSYDYEGVKVYFGAEEKGAGAFLDDHTLIVGDIGHLEDAIDICKNNTRQRLNNDLDKALGNVDRSATFWVAGYMAETMRTRILKKQDPGALIISEIAFFSMSLDIEDGVELKGMFTFQNAEEAEAVEEMMLLGYDILKVFARRFDPVFMEVLKKAKLRSDGPAVYLELSASESEVKEVVEKLKNLKERGAEKLFGFEKFKKAMKK